MSKSFGEHRNHSPTETTRFGIKGHSVRAPRMRSDTALFLSSANISPSVNRTQPHGFLPSIRRITSRIACSFLTDHKLVVFPTHRTPVPDAEAKTVTQCVKYGCVFATGVCEPSLDPGARCDPPVGPRACVSDDHGTYADAIGTCINDFDRENVPCKSDGASVQDCAPPVGNACVRSKYAMRMR